MNIVAWHMTIATFRLIVAEYRFEGRKLQCGVSLTGFATLGKNQTWPCVEKQVGNGRTRAQITTHAVVCHKCHDHGTLEVPLEHVGEALNLYWEPAGRILEQSRAELSLE